MPKKGDKVRFNVVEYHAGLEFKRRTDQVLEGYIVGKYEDAYTVSVDRQKCPYYVEAKDILPAKEGDENAETQH